MQLIRTATEDELLLQGLLYEPKKKSRRAVLHIHGMSGNCYENRFLDAMAAAYSSVGWALLAGNARGRDMIAEYPLVGGKSRIKRIGTAYERFAECVLDLKAWLDALTERGYTELILQGHSLGGSKVVYYQATENDARVSGLILLAPTDMIRYAESQPDHQERVKQAETLVAEGKPDELLPGYIWSNEHLISARTYLDFTTRGNPIDVFKLYNLHAPAAMSTIGVPMLAIMGSRDSGVKAIGETAEEYLKALQHRASRCPGFTPFEPNTEHDFFQHEEEVASTSAKWLTRES